MRSVSDRRHSAWAPWVVPRIVETLAIRIRLSVVGRVKQHPMERIEIERRMIIGVPGRLRVVFGRLILRATLIKLRHGTTSAADAAMPI